ncbi:exopolysaccharide biosynthesis protein [Candidatus Gracilibacteria bacterium]|nr:exopolysaccharide biosynthesis protein [Candidatus Gracilibacteria bacterium]
MKLSSDIKTIFKENESITFGQFIQKISHKSFGVMLVVLAIPSALPLPAAGYSVPFGIILTVLAIQMILNKKYVWFPNWINNRSLPTSKDAKLLNGMVKFLEFFENLLKPRLKILSKGLFYRVLGILVLLCAISMIIPIPLTNTIPAFGVFLVGLGLLEEDGFFILAGLISAIIGLSLTTTILYFFAILGREGINLVQDNFDKVIISIKNTIL